MKVMGCLLAVAMTGCAAQPRLVRLFEGDRPREQVATLWYMDDSRVVVHSIDERREGLAHRCNRKDACRVEILPGRHTMNVSYAERVKTSGPQGDVWVLWESPGKSVSFEVAAGKFYSLSGERGPTDEATWKGLTPPGVPADGRVTLQGQVNTLMGATTAREIKPDEWKIKIEPSGDPDRPVQE